MMRIAISGGGTAGHVYPGLALADALKSEIPSAEILFVGVESGIEKDLVPKAGYQLETLKLERFERRFSLKNAKPLLLLLKGFFRSISILKSFQPDVVVGFGGFASAPLVLAAVFLRKPVILHEANAVAGSANRLLGMAAGAVAISFPEAQDSFIFQKKVVLTGMPVRSSLYQATRDDAAAALKLDPRIKTVLIFGGSKGARAINKTMVQALPLFSALSPLQIIHLTGMIDFGQIQDETKRSKQPNEQVIYHCLPYLDRMELAYAASDLAVSRAGASTIAELVAGKIPSILIPYPFATNDHQEKNARSLERRGAAKVLLNDDLNGKRLFEEVKELISSPSRLQEMKGNLGKIGQSNAAKKLARLVLSVASIKGE